MKVKFLKKHGLNNKDEIMTVDDQLGNYLVRVKAAEEVEKEEIKPSKEKKEIKPKKEKPEHKGLPKNKK